MTSLFSMGAALANSAKRPPSPIERAAIQQTLESVLEPLGNGPLRRPLASELAAAASEALGHIHALDSELFMLQMIKDILEATAPGGDDGRLLVSMHAERSLEIEKELRDLSMGIGRLCASIEPMIHEAATLFDPGLHPSARKAAASRASKTILQLLPARCSEIAGAGSEKEILSSSCPDAAAITAGKTPRI